MWRLHVEQRTSVVMVCLLKKVCHGRGGGPGETGGGPPYAGAGGVVGLSNRGGAPYAGATRFGSGGGSFGSSAISLGGFDGESGDGATSMGGGGGGVDAPPQPVIANPAENAAATMPVAECDSRAQNGQDDSVAKICRLHVEQRTRRLLMSQLRIRCSFKNGQSGAR